MEIKLIKRAGVPKAEVEAHQIIQKEFDQTPFSKGWRGYASFALSRKGRGTGDDDFDLVLVTHANIVIVELKNWNGKHLQSDGHKWFIDGEDRGDSPVAVVNRKVPKLVGQMKQKLGNQKTPFISAYVVIHGNINKMDLPPEEEKSVLNMTEFLSIRFEDCYKDYFWGRPRFNPTNYLNEYDEFFFGPSFKPKIYYIDGFRPDGDAIFAHPKKLYSEYRAMAKEDRNTLALLRQWDFSALGMDLIGESDRPFIGLREQRIFEYVSDRNEELSLSLLRPLTRKNPSDVTIDFAELFGLPPRITRLTEFVHEMLPKLSLEERIGLIKAIINNFAQLHDLSVAHRDIGEHCLWVSRPAKVVMSGLPAAYYPSMKTLGSFREKIKVEKSFVPEDASNNAAATPYNRDVFMLGVIAHLILFGEKPPKVKDIFEWSARAGDPLNGRMNDWLETALHPDPKSRFSNAREMLEAFNESTANKKSSILDIGAFEAFKACTKERDYEEIEIYSDEDDYTFFKAEGPFDECLVKIWHGAKPDERRPDFSLRLLSFLERARTLKGCGLEGIAKVFDFGLSKRSLLLVTEWVEGASLHEWLSQRPSIESRLVIAKGLVDILDRLHSLEFAHGDIHPGNVIIKEEDTPVFIDVLDFHLNTEDAYTTAYLPDNYKSLSPFERDRFGLAAVLVEVLGSTRENISAGNFPLPHIYEELSRLITAENLSSLTPLKNSIDAASKVEEVEEIPEFTVMVNNIAYQGTVPGAMLADNNHFHLSVTKNRREELKPRFRVTGVGRQIFFGWDLVKNAVEFIKIEPVPQSALLRAQTIADVRIQICIKLIDGPNDDIQELLDYLLNIDKVIQKLPLKANIPVTAEETLNEESQEDSNLPPVKHFPISDLWRVLLDAEEGSLRTVVISGEPKINPYRNNQLLVPCHVESGIIDYSSTDKVLAENASADGTWRKFGFLNLHDSSFGQVSELAIDNPSNKARLNIGTKIRLISTLEKASFTRRSFAVDRILNDKALIPNLIDYFSPNNYKMLEPVKYSVPTDDDLDVYSQGKQKLNPSQREAFKKVVGHGPISLLQGPPGTGKTSFIAALLHYLITKERARRILLVSQAHEAVNNALEKALELCRSQGITFDAVRLGSESATSDPIMHLHSTSIEQSYRVRFKSEKKERIVRLAATLGLSKEFAEELTGLHLRLGELEENFSRLKELREQSEEKEKRVLESRVNAISETFFSIASEIYGFLGDMEPREAITHIEKELIDRYEVVSVDAVEKLKKIIRLSNEWLSSLGSPDGNFSEFLAKSRTVVAGTCVGIGYRGAGVVQNNYDWVIIDEAGRAAPSEVAVAMQAGQRILMVGDHKQLPPTFSEDIKSTIRKNYNSQTAAGAFASDFERIFDSGYGKQVGATLLTQYRMAPVIGELVSSCFYDDKLGTERGSPPDYFDLLPDHLSKQVTWVDTAPLKNLGIEKSSEDRRDKWNEGEAKTIMGILREIVESDLFLEFLEEDLKPQEPAIGIICMYSKQREIIDRMKSEATWLGEARRLVKVDTVDSYQGKENRIIILSTVRNDKAMNPGFLRSPNRINVAMSRAMDRLFIVGASNMWKGRNRDLPLGKVYEKVEHLQAEEKASVLPANTFMRG